MTSIRGRLLLLLIAGILPVLLGSYVLLFYLVSGSLTRDFDRALHERAESLSRMAEWWDGDLTDTETYADGGDDRQNLVRFEFAELDLPEFHESEGAEYVQVWDASGLVYARSISLDGDNLPLDIAMTTNAIRDIDLPEEQAGRVAYTAFVPPVEEDSIAERPKTTFVLASARSTRNLQHTLQILRASLLSSGALTLAAAALLIWLGVNRGLRPLLKIGDEIHGIGDDDLSRRIDTRSKPAEIIPVCERLNAMLARLEDSFNRERRFNADVAHELRTPLAELRAAAEVSARRDGLSESERQSYRDMAESAVRMERLVSALLELSRCAAGQITKEARRVNLVSLIENAWRPFSAASAAKGHRLSLSPDTTIEVLSDPLILGTILSNLFSNAVEYTPRGGRISLECTEDLGRISIALSNETDALSRADLDRLFEKFWRKDGPGSGGDRHLGLGLSLVEAFAKALGIEVVCAMPNPGDLRIVLSLPHSVSHSA